MMLSTQGRGHRGGGVVWEIPSTVDMAPCDLVYRSLDDAPPVLVGPRLEQVLRIEATGRVAVLDVEFRHCARLPLSLARRRSLQVSHGPETSPRLGRHELVT